MGALIALMMAILTLAPVASGPGAGGAETTEAATPPATGGASAEKARAKGAAGSWSAAAPAAPGFAAEEQVATGRFLTALEVKPILTATRGSWVAVREYDGQDLVYFTQVLAWRCGLHQIRFAINGGPEQTFEMEPCYVDEAMPGAIKAEGLLPYLTYPLGSVDSVSLRLLYDDNTEDAATFARAAVLMP